MPTREELRKIREELDIGSCFKVNNTPSDSKNCTVDQYLNKHGAIESHADGKRYTTKKGYLDSLKRNNCFIKE